MFNSYLYLRFAVHLPGSRQAETFSKSPDLASWGAPVVLQADISLANPEGARSLLMNPVRIWN